jgi:hypothetical protein
MRKLSLALLLAACSSQPTDPTDTAPRLEITSPARGAMSSERTLVITGLATDDAPGLRVTVNGVAAELAADGAFTASIDVAPGVAVIETRAIDASGFEATDVRAVLAGDLAPVTGAVADGLAARIGAAAFTTIGHALGNAAAGIDFTAAGRAVNPVYANGGCLGATVDITSIELGDIDVGLVPATNTLATTITLDDLVVRLHANYEVACIGGSRDLSVRADRVTIRGDLGLTTGLATSLPSVTVGFTGFDLDVNGLPDAVVNLFNGVVDDKVAAALSNAIRDRVPPLADAALADLASRTYDVPLLGHTLQIHATPSKVTLDATGALIAVDTSLAVSGGDGGMYLTTPSTLDDTAFGDSLGLAIADDAINQLFGGLWAAGALDQRIAADGPIPLAGLLDDEVATLDLELSLPPTVSTTDDVVHLALGDVILSARDAAGVELQRFAVTLTTTLAAATSSSTIQLAIGPPNAWAQVLAQSDRVERPLDAALIEGLIDTVWRLLAPEATAALAELPIPTIAGVTIGDAELGADAGFVVVRADLVMP